MHIALSMQVDSTKETNTIEPRMQWFRICCVRKVCELQRKKLLAAAPTHSRCAAETNVSGSSSSS